MNPIATVGIPFYNAEYTILPALQSVLTQTVSELHIVLINDGSTDRSMEKIATVSDPRIEIYDDGMNLGLSARLNMLSELSSTRYLFRMDADDLMHPRRVEKQLAVLESIQGCDIVGSDMYVFTDDEGLVGKREIWPHISTSRDILRGHSIAHPTIAGRTDWFRANPYDETLRRTEDFDLWLRTFDAVTYCHLSEPLLFYRDSVLSREKYDLALREASQVVLRHGNVRGRRSLALRRLGQLLARRGMAKIFGPGVFLKLAEGRRYSEISPKDRRSAEDAFAELISKD